MSTWMVTPQSCMIEFDPSLNFYNYTAKGGSWTTFQDCDRWRLRGWQVNFFQMGKASQLALEAASFFAEIMHSFNASLVCNGTETDGACALEAVKMGIPYLGICFTQKHCDLLWAHLLRSLCKESLIDSSPLYNHALSNLLTAMGPKTLRVLISFDI